MAKGTRQRSEIEEVRLAVAAYVAAGADESVQRIVTAVHRLSRRLNQWYDRQLADLDITTGEWSVLSELARIDEGEALTPSQLAAAANVAPSSMTHRLDRMVERGLISREPDPGNRTRVLVRMSDAGWQLYASAIRESNVVEADLIAGLTGHQVDELASLLERLIAGLDEAVV
jgi:DNA-binding MarR family transcriptional regulator